VSRLHHQPPHQSFPDIAPVTNATNTQGESLLCFSVTATAGHRLRRRHGRPPHGPPSRGSRQAASVARLPRSSFGCGWSCRWRSGSLIAPRFRRPQGLAGHRPTPPTGMDVGFHMRRGGAALPATGTGAVDLNTQPAHGPDDCDRRRPDDGPPESAYGRGMGIVPPPGFSGHGRPTPDLPPGQDRKANSSV
jgi:hypothetical protein